MSISVIPRRSRRIVVLSTLLNALLLALAQTGLWYVSVRTDQTLWWLIGTPICSFLIGGQAAFWATGNLLSRGARRTGAQIGALVGIGSLVLAALMVTLMSIWWVEDIQAYPHRLSLPNLFVPPGVVYVGPFFRLFLTLFLLLNLLGLVLAPLGGMVGGNLRKQSSREKPWAQK